MSESGEIAPSHSRDCWRKREPRPLRSPEEERERYREGEQKRLPRRFPPRSLSVEGEREGPEWAEPEVSTRFTLLMGEGSRVELSPGMGEQAGGSLSWPPSPPEAGGGTGEAATSSLTQPVPW